MSLIVGGPQQSFQVRDPRLELSSGKGAIIAKGAASFSASPQVTSNFSNSQISFNFVPNSNLTGIDRKFVLKVPVRLDFTGADQGSPLLQLNQSLAAFRSFPISSIIQNISLNINNTQFMMITSEVIHELMKYHRSQEMGYLSDSTLNQQDMYPEYADGNGASNNPLNNYQSSGYHDIGRGGYNSTVTVVYNTNTAARIDAVLYEEIYLSPLLFQKDEGPAFIYVNTLDIQMQLGNLARLWSCDQTNGHIYTVQGTIMPSPTLLINQLTPQLNEVIPKQVVYNFDQVNQFTTTVGSVNAGAVFTQVCSNIQLGNVPKAIYVFAKERLQDLTPTSTDTNAALLSVSVNLGNRTGLLSSMTQYDLYQLAKKNGLEQASWLQWSKFTGSVLRLDPAEDLSLDALTAPGMINYQANLQITAQFQNLSSRAINYTMYVVVVYDGLFTLQEGGNAIQQLGIVTKQDVLDSRDLPFVEKAVVRSMYGGDFLSTLKNLGSKAYGFLKDTKIASTIAKAIPHPYAQVAATGLEALGLGGKRKGRGIGDNVLPDQDVQRVGEVRTHARQTIGHEADTHGNLWRPSANDDLYHQQVQDTLIDHREAEMRGGKSLSKSQLLSIIGRS